MKYVNSFSASTNSINSTSSLPAAMSASSAAAVVDGSNGSSFEELVSKLFSCNVVLVLTDQARQYLKCCFGPNTTAATFANVLNQFASVGNLHSTIRDLNGHNAYALNKLRFRFFDVDQFKSRPNGAQLRKLHFDVISSMSNSYLNNPSEAICDDSGDGGDGSENIETPWYDLWRNIFIDTFEPSDHDFIGSSCGCFFVITKHELPHYKVIFERLCASVKQNSSLRFIQSDFVRYFIVLSDQILEPASPNADEYTRTCHNLKVEFPNSFIFYLEQSQLQEQLNQQAQTNSQQTQQQQQQSNPLFIVGDGPTDSLNSDMNSLTIDDPTQLNIDPLNAANLEYQQQQQQQGLGGGGGGGRFYNQLQNQRNAQQLQKANSTASSQGGGGGGQGGASPTATSVSSGNSREMFSDWIASTHQHEHLKEISEAISETIDFMLREFISKSLIPWAERQIKILGELIAQRKGFRKSIFSATKSLISNMSSSTASLTKSITGSSTSLGGMPSGVIYIPDAQEMQQRKLADICMIFGVYEMAYNLYYGARKDFQTEGAWLYYAGASEMSAIASYFIQKFHPNYFDQAITTYMDTCRSINLATRAAIIATELFCQMNRHIDAANLYIRLTGDDSDLRSALFLEQASKCFLAVSPNLTKPSLNFNNNSASSSQLLLQRSASTQSLLLAMARSTNIETVGVFGSRYRKAAFHYILAGHRYNRCGLKHFALTCYRRFNYPYWEAASDHVNLTVAKLFLSIAAVNLKKFEDYFLRGLEIYRNCSHKQIFFSELFRELKKYNTPSSSSTASICDPEVRLDSELYLLEVPFIHSYLFVSFDSLQPQEFSIKSRDQRHTCFMGEQIEIQFSMSCPFPLTIGALQLICNEAELIHLESEQEAIQFETPDQVLELTLRLTPKVEGEFSLIGVEYEVDGIQFRKMFTERMQQSLNFKAVRTLPLIPVEIAIPQLGLDFAAINRSKHAQNSVLMIPVKVYGSEMITLNIVAHSAMAANWAPSSIKMFSSAKQYYPWPMSSIVPDATDDSDKIKEYPVPIQYGYGPMDLQIHIPPKCERHVVSIRLVYTDEQSKQSRTVLRKLSFEVIPCVDLEAKYDSVIQLKNLCPDDPIAIWDVTVGADEVVAGIPADSPDSTFVSIPVDNSAYLLALKTFARWTLPTTITQIGGTEQTTTVPCRNGMILFS